MGEVLNNAAVEGGVVDARNLSSDRTGMRIDNLEGASVLRLTPSAESIAQVASFLEEQLETLDIPLKMANKLMIAMDEIYSNIARCSGADYAEVHCGLTDGVLHLVFRDNGVQYNPLMAAAPNTTLSVEERDIGGLGILMVRKMMDQVEYRYENNVNVLTLSLKVS